MDVLRKIGFIAAFLLVPCVSNAQTVDAKTLARAQLLVEAGAALMTTKQFAKARPLLEEATRLVPKGIGAKLELAKCHSGAGRLASAWRQYVLAEKLAIAARDDRAYEARTEAKRLERKLATITIVVPDSVRSIAGLSITWDGVEQGPDGWGTPVPVDMGTHDLEANAPGRQSWKYEVKIMANGRPYVESVPMLVVDSKTFTRILWDADFPQWRKGLIGTTTSLAFLGIGVGIGFTIAARARDAEAITAMEAIRYRRSVNEMVCPVGQLDPACNELRSLLDARNTYARVATGSLIGGGLAVAGTVALRLISRKNTEAKKEREALVVVPTLSGFLVTGTF